jgi:hypothetical protein
MSSVAPAPHATTSSVRASLVEPRAMARGRRAAYLSVR